MPFLKPFKQKEKIENIVSLVKPKVPEIDESKVKLLFEKKESSGVYILIFRSGRFDIDSIRDALLQCIRENESYPVLIQWTDHWGPGETVS